MCQEMASNDKRYGKEDTFELTRTIPVPMKKKFRRNVYPTMLFGERWDRERGNVLGNKDDTSGEHYEPRTCFSGLATYSVWL